ncbi:hypothetical protein GCM10018781_71460 [Kitasatospora indigofera]|uniref:Uncharacterized protein n=1 Tax=Kitasatospora indigofera TaxID=67307 RepID=A0A919L4P3_9ACTN|nr:hypothetical protein GCM10018781_71460 [Kitasatospora indigofera]
MQGGDNLLSARLRRPLLSRPFPAEPEQGRPPAVSAPDGPAEGPWAVVLLGFAARTVSVSGAVTCPAVAPKDGGHFGRRT